MPRWLCWWGEKDEQDEVNVAELLEQVERQRAIIEEQSRQIKQLHDWIDQIPKTREVTE